MRISEIKSVDSLSYGDDEELPRLTAVFRPQREHADAVVRGFTNVYDIVGAAIEFDVTEAFLRMSASDIREYQENSYSSDNLAHGLPERMRHNGPFEVDLDVDDIEDFLNHFNASRDTISPSELEYIRLRYGVTKGVEPA